MRVRLYLSYTFAAACLFWIFHNVPFGDVLRSITRINGWLVAVAVLFDLAVYLCAAWEWQLLLQPLGRLPFWRTAQALFAGRFANDVLPVHAGYIIRIYLVSRWLKQSISAILPSLFLERFFDGSLLVLCIGGSLLFFPLPPKLVRTGEILGALILVGGIALAFITWRRARTPKPEKQPAWKVTRALSDFLQQITDGIRAVALPRLLLPAFALSVAKLLGQAAAFLLLLWSYGFSFPFWTSIIVFLVAYVGVSVPSTPAGAGVFQVFCVAGLRFFGIPKIEATSFALLSFVILTAPLAIAGFIAFAQTGL
ncbi:MAG TPA: lysylphosphatidylglycerol synthase transmembrane domain-containing protein, partial [Candidatus Dormibacteraeota bacterium]|nr:lysylphosphatidylglycerol synthase transmembrane domain-containing protein [Candidatus Dormibacteraeota bacterium]